MSIKFLRGIALGAHGLTKQEGFFNQTWGLTTVAHQDGAVYLRGTSAEHHILALHDRPVRGVIQIEFGVADKTAVDQLYGKLAGQGVAVTQPAQRTTPGGGFGFTARDPDGHTLAITADIARHNDTADNVDRPRKVSHVVLNSADLDRMRDFYTQAFDFKISDWSEDQMVFLRCDTDHHCVALNRATHASINHIAYEMPSVHAYMRGQGRLKSAGCPVAWGPGRHGPGNNPFAYFVVPGNFVFEYTCELQQIDPATHQPKVWRRTPEESDLWGTAGPPSPAIRAAMAGNPDPNWTGA